MSHPSPSGASQFALALHTASPELGLALSNLQGEDRHQVWDLGRSLSTDLHLYLNEFIQPYRWTDLAWIAVAKGPGGFTGTRLGVVTARTLAQQLNIPLYAISTLAAIAWSASLQPHHPSWTVETIALEAALRTAQTDHSNAIDIAVQMPAQRGELYTAIYSVDHQKLSERFPDSVLNHEKWQQTLANWDKPIRLIQVSGSLGESVTALLALALHDWQKGTRPNWTNALPFYGQSPV
ncbi:tRNA (adenosine(37)-N6)-threonylcarbamoyltransferase complex dimerization subunit type 1 TsaB [Oculatella sp. LEGE 06141]|uniref:tRNA (adenosine(37)-N6)-threonylcarbamoyltransferase complex dimerization subunit type 1 TsaB n=1 Tax=Oculatella sp. LEGE 06141 TaxID=1828648 RepID=UPI0018820C92|nr:tRNA (adenosine(37)-N6)-threonylcarbamoyltransferase complex dimerization subunit type 1 TsaB [Oculatella sp. LEGE 06141]MBE9178872.1 tRNA (adenosine(37)-N6)-threonylcarbamoyltransferase complex dimerization subunit type 1 TsaB [Oculatella sp. LEGE 06141]